MLKLSTPILCGPTVSHPPHQRTASARQWSAGVKRDAPRAGASHRATGPAPALPLLGHLGRRGGEHRGAGGRRGQTRGRKDVPARPPGELMLSQLIELVDRYQIDGFAGRRDLGGGVCYCEAAPPSPGHRPAQSPKEPGEADYGLVPVQYDSFAPTSPTPRSTPSGPRPWLFHRRPSAIRVNPRCPPTDQRDNTWSLA